MQRESGRLVRRVGWNGCSTPLRRLVRPLAVCLALLVAGCAATAAPVVLDGPATPAAFEVSGWRYLANPGWCLTSAHYRLFTTLNDAEINKSVIQVMEAALAEYQKIAPGVPLSNRPMDCYLFGSREQWTDFTRRHTGIDARIYLQITRGGYTVRDWYVAYFVGESATYSVAAHEGWHQFVFRNFKGRLPPFLEEGIATMFEDMHWHHDLPQWNLAMNRTRVAALRRAVEGNYLYPLDQLIGMHAGNVVNQSNNHIEAFYAQSWGFAAFLWSGDGGRYRPAMRRLMSDTADGSVFDPTGVFQDARHPWNPAGVGPMLEHYLGMTLSQIDAAYQRFIRDVAFDNYGADWN
jgi:hypothetical protein